MYADPEPTDRALVIITARRGFHEWVTGHPVLWLERRPPSLDEINQTPLAIIVPAPAPESPLGVFLPAALDHFLVCMGLKPDQPLLTPGSEFVDFSTWFEARVITTLHQCRELPEA